MKNSYHKDKEIPLFDIDGNAFECGRCYADLVLSRSAAFTEYLGYLIADWNQLKGNKKLLNLFEEKSPCLLEVIRGMAEICEKKLYEKEICDSLIGNDCTSFFVSSANTAEGFHVCGQNKDTPYDKADLYIILRMKIKNGPSILVLAYPGELLGYGIWNNGNSIFRNSLYSSAVSQNGLDMRMWGLLAMSGNSIYDGIEIANRFGIKGEGNVILSDSKGQSVSVEFNAGGIDYIFPNENGIITHANHPVGEKTSPFEDYPDSREKNNSRYREQKLLELLESQSGKLTPSIIFKHLSDHSAYPRGICRHVIGDSDEMGTTAAIVAEPMKGKLHIAKGNPCNNNVRDLNIEMV